MDEPQFGPPFGHVATLPDGRWLWVYPLTFGRARLSVGAAGRDWFDDEW